MAFEVFTEHQVEEEVRKMLIALKEADYAISDLTREQIQQYADKFSIKVKLHRLKNGRVKVKRSDKQYRKWLAEAVLDKKLRGEL